MGRNRSENNFLTNLGAHVLSNYLIKLEERPKVPKAYFPPYLESKISVSKAHLLSSFPASFQRFSLKFGENVAR